MPDLSLRAAAPQSAASTAVPVYPFTLTITWELEEPATLNADFGSEWDKFNTESDTTNALQMGAYLLFTRDSVNVFRGYVQRRDSSQAEGARTFSILGLDKFGKIRRTAASSGGAYIFTMTTPAMSFSQKDLVYLGTKVEDTYRYFPDTTETACYLPTLSYAIGAVQQTPADKLQISGDHTNEFYAGVVVRIYGSTGNDGYKTVAGSSYSSPNTEITLVEDLPDGTADGFIQSEFRTNWDTLATDFPAGAVTITGIQQTPTDQITIDGDWVDLITELLNVPGALQVTGSTGNDDTYTPTAVSLSGGDTVITVSEDLADGTVDGTVVIRMMPLSNTYKALLPEGLVMIGTEAVYYTAYFSADSGRWVLLVDTRGACETTAASHSADDEARQLIPLKIHPAEPILVEGLTGESPEWGALNDGQYFPQIEEGWIEFTQDLHEMLVFLDYAEDEPRRGYTALRMSYSAFDELSSSAVTLENLATTLLTATKANAGPGLSASEYNVDIPSIRLTRVVVDEPALTMDVLDQIEGEIGFQGTGDIEVISSFYDSQNDKMNYKAISQQSTPDRIITAGYRVDQDVSLDDIHSAVIVKYQSSTRTNLARRTRSWVPSIGDSIGDLSPQQTVTGYLIQKSEQISGFGWTEYTSYPGGTTDEEKATFADFCFDGLEYSGFGLSASTQPGSDCLFMYCWFDDEASTFTLDRIKAVFDVRRDSDPNYPIDIKIVGYTSFTPPVYSSGSEVSPPSASGEINLHGALRARYEPDQDTDSISSHTMEANDIGVDCQAIGIIFDGIPSTRDDLYRMMLKELEINGAQTKAVLVKLVGQFVDADPYAFLNAPDTYDKLLDETYGMYDVDIIDAGVATRATAIGLGRLSLLQSLALIQTRVYECGLQAGIPVLGETVRMPDSYEGIAISVQYSVSEGTESLTLRVLDTTTELI